MAEQADLVNALAKTTGVAAGDVKKVLDFLGLDALRRELKSAASTRELKVGDLKLAARLGKSSLAV